MLQTPNTAKSLQIDGVIDGSSNSVWVYTGRLVPHAGNRFRRILNVEKDKSEQKNSVRRSRISLNTNTAAPRRCQLDRHGRT